METPFRATTPRVFTHKRTSPVVTRLGYETRGASDISARAAVMGAGEMTSERQKGSDPWRGDGSAPPPPTKTTAGAGAADRQQSSGNHR